MDDVSPTTSTAHCYSSLEIITSQRGGKILLKDGYKYNKKRENMNGHTIWLCTHRKCCRAVLITNSAGIVIKQQSHECESDALKNELTSTIHKYEQQAINESTPMPTIYANAVEELQSSGIDLLVKLPKYNNLKKTLYKKRNKALQAQKTRFLKLQDVEVPGVFKEFVLADYTYQKTKILLFASEQARQILKNAKDIFLDGTFKAAVPPFVQLYTLHVDLGSTDANTNIVPVLYALLPGKKQLHYEILFYLIKSQIPEFSPTTITSDFEASAMLAAQNAFPGTILRGCIFHFKQAVQRKAKKLGLTKTSTVSRGHVRRCMALAYLPLTCRSDGWLYVLSQCLKLDEKTAEFNLYFENTWLREQSFLADKWCFYNVRHKTNNAIESWNSRLNKKINNKPNLAFLLKTLMKDASYYWSLWNNNGYISKRCNETILREKRINDSTRELVDQEISIGHCIERLSY